MTGSSRMHWLGYSVDYALAVLVALLLLPLATLLLLRSRKPKIHVYVSLGRLLKLRVTASVQDEEGGNHGESD